MQDEMNDIQYTRPEDPDIVKVVRCKDCRKFINHDKRCGYWDHGVKPNDYCSYGGPKDEPAIH